MARKSKFTTDDIINAAFNVVRNQGYECLSAQSIAEEMNASTMPIYSYLKSMKNLESLLLDRAIDLLITYQIKIRTGDPFLDMGVGYIMFARDEKKLYNFINNEQFLKTQNIPDIYSLKIMPKTLSDLPILKDISEEKKRNITFTMWVLFHGLAILMNTSVKNFSEEEIMKFLQSTGVTLMNGFTNIVTAERISGNPFSAYEGMIRTAEIEINILNRNEIQTSNAGVSIDNVGVNPYQGVYLNAKDIS